MMWKKNSPDTALHENYSKLLFYAVGILDIVTNETRTFVCGRYIPDVQGFLEIPKVWVS
jgi:hypothetical protein